MPHKNPSILWIYLKTARACHISSNVQFHCFRAQVKRIPVCRSVIKVIWVGRWLLRPTNCTVRMLIFSKASALNSGIIYESTARLSWEIILDSRRWFCYFRPHWYRKRKVLYSLHILARVDRENPNPISISKFLVHFTSVNYNTALKIA